MVSVAHAEDFQKTVDADVLKKFLPVAPQGWKVENIVAANTETMGAPTTVAQCRYVLADNKDKTPASRVELQINDWANRKDTLRKMIGIWAVTNDSDEGSYMRGTIVAGYPGEESFEKSDGTHSLTLIVGGRYCINLDVYGRPEAALNKWLNLLDLKTLAETK